MKFQSYTLRCSSTLRGALTGAWLVYSATHRIPPTASFNCNNEPHTWDSAALPQRLLTHGTSHTYRAARQQGGAGESRAGIRTTRASPTACASTAPAHRDSHHNLYEHLLLRVEAVELARLHQLHIVHHLRPFVGGWSCHCLYVGQSVRRRSVWLEWKVPQGDLDAAVAAVAAAATAAAAAGRASQQLGKLSPSIARHHPPAPCTV